MQPADKAYLGILDSLDGIVGDIITPQLIQTVVDVCASHCREHGLPVVEPTETMGRLRRRMKPDGYKIGE